MGLPDLGMTARQRDEAVFLGDLLAIAPVQFDQRAWVGEGLADAEGRARTSERVQDALALRRGERHAPLDQALVQLRRMPRPTLLAVADDAREIEHVAGHPASRVRPLVGVLLPP